MRPGALTFARRVGAPLRAYRLEGAEHLRDGRARRGRARWRCAAYHTPGHTSRSPRVLRAARASAVHGRRGPGPGDELHRSAGRGSGAVPALARPACRSWARRSSTRGTVRWCSAARRSSRSTCDHRAEREEQVLARHGERARPRSWRWWSEIYADYPPEVHALAARSVLAHLLKLQSEGRADKRGKGLDAEWFVVAPRACERCGRPVRGRARYCNTLQPDHPAGGCGRRHRARVARLSARRRGAGGAGRSVRAPGPRVAPSAPARAAPGSPTRARSRPAPRGHPA